jgi:hypothetical protein
MPFSQRNIFYLRASPHVVLQTILYLDPRDLRWMNSSAYNDRRTANNKDNDELDSEEQSTGDIIWAKALSKLRYKIMPKLRAESIEGEYLSSTNKKEKVDVHIEPDFQMAYFFRKTSGKHAVLLKEKKLQFPASPTSKTEASMEMPPPMMPASAMQRSNAADEMPLSRLANRQSNQQRDNIVSLGSRIENEEGIDIKPRKRLRDDDDEEPSASNLLEPQPIRIKEEDTDDVQLLDDMPMSAAQEEEIHQAVESIDVDATVADDKKPKLHVNYSGYRIFGKCFIVVIEPTKRTKRLRPLLFQTEIPVERHQLSATPVPRQSRETPLPSSRATPNRRNQSVDLDEEGPRSDSRRLSGGLFRGTPSDYTPTPTPEPSERRAEMQNTMAVSEGAAATSAVTFQDTDEEVDMDKSSSVMLATQMLEGGIAGQGNDIDDD